MKNRYSRLAVVLLAAVFAFSVSASFDARPIGVLKGSTTAHDMIPGQQSVAGLVRQAVGAYVVARFMTNLGNQRVAVPTVREKTKTLEISNTARCSGAPQVLIAN